MISSGAHKLWRRVLSGVGGLVVLGLLLCLNSSGQDTTDAGADAKAAAPAEAPGAKPAGEATAEGTVAAEADAAAEKTGEGADAATAKGETTAPAPPEPKVEAPPPEVEVAVAVGDRSVVNLVRGRPGQRKKWRAPELWQHFMHGTVDFFATPVPWEELLGADQKPAEWLDPAQMLLTRYKQSGLPAVRIAGGKSLALATRLPIDVRPFEGRWLRVFVWIKADGVGVQNDCWAGPPGMDLELRDSAGKVVLAEYSALMKTQGTFPWHCYYRDVFIPGEPQPDIVVEDEAPDARAVPAAGEGDDGAEAEDGDDEKKAKTDEPVKNGKADASSDKKADAKKGKGKVVEDLGPGLFVRLFNPSAGTAWYSTLSWEPITTQNRYTLEEMQDPVSGSVAPNVMYDELPYHFRWGKPVQYQWAFWNGVAAGLKGQPHDLTTKAGFAEYYVTKAKQDPMHFCYAVAALAEWYHLGKRFEVLPRVDEDWPTAVAEVIKADQDAESGLWGYGKTPRSLAATRQVLDRLFGEARIVRADRDSGAAAWLSLVAEKPPRMAQILTTVLDMQASYAVDGKQVPAAWASSAYDFRVDPSHRPEHRCSLAATGNAMYLLRVTAEEGSRDRKARAYEAVAAAYRYAIEHCVTPEGLWKQNDTDNTVTSGAFLPAVIEFSQCLERRTSPEVPTGVVTATAAAEEGGPCQIRWKDAPDKCVSLRVFAAPPGTAPEDLDESFLVGILTRTAGEKPIEMDPLLLVRRLQAASARRWNRPWTVQPDAYTEWKLAKLPRTFAVQINAAPMSLTVPDLAEKELFACGVNWYGEHSVPLRVGVTAAGPAEEGQKKEAGKKDGKAAAK